MSKREQSLFDILRKVYPDHHLFVQVALSQLIEVSLGRRHPHRQSIWNRYSRLVADFVLYRPDMSILAVIELDDRTHLWPHRKAADARKTKVLADAGLRLIRIPPGPLPSMDSLRTTIDAADSSRSDQMTAHSLQSSGMAEWELRLVEDWNAPIGGPAKAIEDDAKSPSLRGPVLRVVLGLAVLILGWYSYSQVLVRIGKDSIESKLHATGSVPRIDFASSPSMALFRTPPTRVTTVPQLDTTQRAEALSAAEKGRRKEQAWVASYVPPASCEHPVDWSAQVECGNRYMRAKQAFERQWARQNEPNSRPSNGVVLDNQSVSKVAH